MPKTVAIASRWAPGHRIRIDTQAGTYEEVNAPLVRSSEVNVQNAFLPPLRKRPKGSSTVYSRAWERAREAQGLKPNYIESVNKPAKPSKPTGYPWLWWASICCIALGSMALIIRSAETMPR